MGTIPEIVDSGPDWRNSGQMAFMVYDLDGSQGLDREEFGRF